MLKVLGCVISERAQRAGRVALAAQVGTFGASNIAHAMQRYVRLGADAWAAATVSLVAKAAADVLLWEACRVGQIQPAGFLFGVQQWRRTVGTQKGEADGSDCHQTPSSHCHIG